MELVSTAGFDSSTCKSLYVGNLHPYVNEAMLQEIFATLGPVAEVKVIKDKVTGMSAGYGFVKFLDHRAADLALQSINGRVLYGQASPYCHSSSSGCVGCRSGPYSTGRS